MAEKQTQKENLQFTENLDKIKQYATVVENVLQLVDLTSNSTKTWTVFNKETLRQYMQSPYSASSQASLRNLAKFLYTLSFPLRRIVNYFASLPDFSAYKVNLGFSLVEDNDEDALLQDYEDACRYVRKMNLVVNMFKLLVIAWREGIVYFQPYQDEDGELLLMPLDSQYCKVGSIGYNNLLHVAFDFSFFRGSNSFYLDIWDGEFQTKYNAFERDTSLRWQELDNARAIKIDLADIDLVLSPFASLFEGLIDLIDLQALMAVKDALDIYKLLVMKIPLLNSNNPDDLALNLNLAKQFYNRAVEDLPPEVAMILSPGMEIDSISFDKSATTDTNAIADSYQNLMEQTGISQIFDSSRLTGSTSVQMSMLSDAMMATKGIVQQVEAFVNERILMQYPNSTAYVKFIEVTNYSKTDRIREVKEAASLGLSVKLEYMSLLGYDPLESMASDWLETKLGLATERFIHPLVSSHTQASGSSTGGAPTSEESGEPLSDDGEASRDKRDAVG